MVSPSNLWPLQSRTAGTASKFHMVSDTPNLKPTVLFLSQLHPLFPQKGVVVVHELAGWLVLRSESGSTVSQWRSRANMNQPLWSEILLGASSSSTAETREPRADAKKKQGTTCRRKKKHVRSDIYTYVTGKEYIYFYIYIYYIYYIIYIYYILYILYILYIIMHSLLYFAYVSF